MRGWLRNEDGTLRRELFTQSDAEIDEKAAELDAHVARGDALGPTFRHEVFVDPTKWSITDGTDGWMEVVRVDLRIAFLCKGKRGGGFIAVDMISGWRTRP